MTRVELGIILAIGIDWWKNADENFLTIWPPSCVRQQAKEKLSYKITGKSRNPIDCWEIWQQLQTDHHSILSVKF